MNNKKNLIAIAVSLYIVFFLIAIWSALPSSFTGSSASGLASIAEQQLAGCAVETNATEGSKWSEFQPKDNAGSLAGAMCNCWTGVSNREVYACALLTGALYN